MDESDFLWSVFQRTTYGVRDRPCCLQHCCYNFTPDIRGNCLLNFEDILECFVDKDDMMGFGDPGREEVT